MLTFLYISSLFFLLFLLLALLAVLFLKISSLHFTGAPYIQIPDEVVPEIIKALEIKPGSRVYDLGCGDARVLVAGYRQEPRARYVGIDHALWPILVARGRLKRLGLADSIEIRKEDVFAADLSPATHLFLYLYPKMINELLPKLEKELGRGSRVVTCDYQFEKKKPTRVVNLGRHQGELGKFLYIYEF